MSEPSWDNEHGGHFVYGAYPEFGISAPSTQGTGEVQ